MNRGHDVEVPCERVSEQFSSEVCQRLVGPSSQGLDVSPDQIGVAGTSATQVGAVSRRRFHRKEVRHVKPKVDL